LSSCEEVRAPTPVASRKRPRMSRLAVARDQLDEQVVGPLGDRVVDGVALARRIDEERVDDLEAHPPARRRPALEQPALDLRRELGEDSPGLVRRLELEDRPGL